MEALVVVVVVVVGALGGTCSSSCCCCFSQKGIDNELSLNTVRQTLTLCSTIVRFQCPSGFRFVGGWCCRCCTTSLPTTSTLLVLGSYVGSILAFLAHSQPIFCPRGEGGGVGVGTSGCSSLWRARVHVGVSVRATAVCHRAHRALRVALVFFHYKLQASFFFCQVCAGACGYVQFIIVLYGRDCVVCVCICGCTSISARCHSALLWVVYVQSSLSPRVCVCACFIFIGFVAFALQRCSSPGGHVPYERRRRDMAHLFSFCFFCFFVF